MPALTRVYSWLGSKQFVGMLKMLDIPPVWLGLSILFVWALGPYLTLGQIAGPVMIMAGWGLNVMGLVLILAAAWSFFRHSTTIIPHQTPARVIQSGVFALTRNPIYLGDALILAGCCLVLGAFLGLILVPVFMWWITVRFITDEEGRMRAAMPDEFMKYERKVRRWM